MQNHVEEHDLSKEPRKLLVGGMAAKQILLATPLLKWYLDHGLVVSKMHRVIELTPMRCFRDFAYRVCQARRGGDKYVNKAVIAESMKLIGNSAYGSLLMRKEKHRNIDYIEREREMKL